MLWLAWTGEFLLSFLPHILQCAAFWASLCPADHGGGVPGWNRWISLCFSAGQWKHSISTASSKITTMQLSGYSSSCDLKSHALLCLSRHVSTSYSPGICAFVWSCVVNHLCRTVLSCCLGSGFPRFDVSRSGFWHSTLLWGIFIVALEGVGCNHLKKWKRVRRLSGWYQRYLF